MQPEAMLDAVCRSIDVLIRAGEGHDGLFPSMLNVGTGEMLAEAPPPIEGQRPGDRAYQGCNLMHDESTLRTMYAIAEALGRADYAEAADRYLKRFAVHCTGTASGLFPWGEHAYWHLTDDRVASSYHESKGTPSTGDAIHDHLRHAPLWLWEKLWQFNPRCVERFAEGLDNHWTNGEPPEYIRHAFVEKKQHHPRGARSCDFPRHSGFYIFDLSVALAKTGRDEFRVQIERFLDYWWGKRDARDLLLIESRCPEEDRFFRINSPAQTLSLAAGLYESAPVIESGHSELAARMRERAAVYVNGFFAGPHDLERGVYVILSGLDTNEVTRAMPVWGSVYGVWPASYVALTCLCIHRITSDPRLLEWAASVGRRYAAEPFPEGVSAPAMDAGMGLGLLADLYDVTDDAQFLDAAATLSGRIVATFFGGDLLRSAVEIDWYESQMGPGFLLHGLARTALLAMDRDACPLDADYTGR